MEKQFFFNLLKKSLVMAGFTYFSVAASTLQFTNIIPSLIAGGSYFFIEAMRFYNMSNLNSEAKRRHKSQNTFTFLI